MWEISGSTLLFQGFNNQETIMKIIYEPQISSLRLMALSYMNFNFNIKASICVDGTRKGPTGRGDVTKVGPSLNTFKHEVVLKKIFSRVKFEVNRSLHSRVIVRSN